MFGAKETRECDIVIVFLFLLICVYHQGQRPEYCFLGRQPKLGLSPSRASPPENLISSSTSSGKALVTTELDVLVCNTFSSRTNRDAS